MYLGECGRFVHDILNIAGICIFLGFFTHRFEVRAAVSGTKPDHRDKLTPGVARMSRNGVHKCSVFFTICDPFRHRDVSLNDASHLVFLAKIYFSIK